MNIFNRFARFNHFVVAFCMAFVVPVMLSVPTYAQQTVDPSGTCTTESLGRFINAQTGTFYCVPSTPGSATGTWQNVGQGVKGVYAAHAVYSFAVDGGAIATITPATNATIPVNAIIFGVIANSTTALTSGGSATIAIGTSAGSSTTALKGATAVASYSANALLAGTPVFTVGSAVKLSAAGSITITVAVATLTAGVLDITVLYVLPNA